MAALANLTVIAITLSRGFSQSPAFALPHKSVKNAYTISKSQFRNHFSPVIFSQFRSFREFTIDRTGFENFVNSAIHIDHEQENFETSIEYVEFNQTLEGKQISSNLKIHHCVFLRLANFQGGGAIYVGDSEDSVELNIRFCGFRQCHANSNGGAILYSGASIVARQTCFDKCYCFEKGQAVCTFDSMAEFDQSTVMMCSMDRPCGRSGALCMTKMNQKVVSSNISHNTVVEKGAACESIAPNGFVFNYVMVSHNVGSSLFTINSDFEIKSPYYIHHCSVINNRIDRNGPVFDTDSKLSLEADNFIRNSFKDFAVGGEITIVRRITIDFDLQSKVQGCKITNREGAYKISFVEANMAYMNTWDCWAMGTASPSATQSVPALKNLQVQKEDSGLISFIVITAVGLIPTIICYYYCANKSRDLSVLDDVKISNT